MRHKHHWPHVLCGASLLLACSNASAEIYRCSIDGKTVLRDVPCPGTATFGAADQRPATAQPANAPATAAAVPQARAEPSTPHSPMTPDERAARMAELQSIIAAGSMHTPQPQAPVGASHAEIQAANQRATAAEARYAAGFTNVQAAQQELIRLQSEQRADDLQQRSVQAGDIRAQIASLEADRRSQMYSRGCIPGHRQDAAATSAAQRQQLEKDDQRGDYERKRHGPPSEQEQSECTAINAEASDQISQLSKQLDRTRMTSKGPVTQERDWSHLPGQSGQ